MTLDEFRQRFPEFRPVADELVESVLAEARPRVSKSVYGGLYKAAVGYLAAHTLSTSPFGTNQRLEDSKADTTYWTQYLAIRQQVVVRSFVT